MHIWFDQTWCMHQRVADMLAGAVLGGVAVGGLVVLAGLEVLRRATGLSARDVLRH